MAEQLGTAISTRIAFEMLAAEIQARNLLATLKL
jgi:hypothetical protein